MSARIALMAAFTSVWLAASPMAAAGDAVTVYKSPSCGCCKLWVEHMRGAGFEVQTHDMLDVTPQKQRLGVPAQLASCHTAEVGGYVIEGHVPADDVRRLLAARPDAVGLAVPGMPMGSPGMEFGAPEPYDVIVFRRDGTAGVFASHGR
jgi:hypothetical protein